jgi:hypothetical protein
MTIQAERWLLDTNIWILGLRRDRAFPACAELLDEIGSFLAVISLQVLKEPNVNLTKDELRGFYELVNDAGDSVELNWEPASVDRVNYYAKLGCKRAMPSSPRTQKFWMST